MARKTTLEQVIREMMQDPDKEGPCTMLSLVHLQGASANEDEVHTVKLGKGGKEWKPDALAKLFMGKAEVHCQDMTGLQAYRLLAFYSGSDEAQAKHRFTVAGRGNEDHGVTEPPTKEGRMMQDMRITEGIVKVALQSHTQIIQMLTERLEKSEDRNVTAFELAEKVLLSKYEQEIKLQRAQMWNKLAEKSVALLPAMANQLTGREVFPQNTQDTAIIDAICEHIKPEQIQMLSSLFPPELAGILMARLRKKHDEAVAETNAMMKRPPEVEIDAEEVEAERKH